jgi:hypothetical protein
MRLRTFTLTLVVALLVALSALAAQAAASHSYTDSISGYEYAFTSTEGYFAGTASGDLPGTWNVDVKHTPLCLDCKPTATITGGSFQLATTVSGRLASISGSFSGGIVQVTDVGANCTNQTFAIQGDLSGLGPSQKGTGSFDATLTHYRHSVFGICVTYAASVDGTVTLNL